MGNTSGTGTQATRGFAQRLKEDGRQTLEQRKRSAADRVEGIAQALERTGAQFSDNEPTLAEFANRLATTVGNLATRLREGSLDDLLDDTRAFARRNPGLFIAGGVAAGFALSRFVKASARRPLESELSDSEASAEDAPTLSDEVLAADADVEAAVMSETTPRPGGGVGA